MFSHLLQYFESFKLIHVTKTNKLVCNGRLLCLATVNFIASINACSLNAQTLYAFCSILAVLNRDLCNQKQIS